MSLKLIYMYVSSDTSIMVIHYNSRQETEMSGTSLPAGRGLPTSDFPAYRTGRQPV